MLCETPIFRTVFNSLIFKTVIQLAKDGVPNIRMGIAKCLSTALTCSYKFENDEQYADAVKHLRQLQCDRDSDVREMAICSALPPPENNIDEDQMADNDDGTDKDHRCVSASISNASTVDMNCTDEDGCGKGNDDGDESEESQDSIKLYWDTDEKNTSKFSDIFILCCHKYE